MFFKLMVICVAAFLLKCGAKEKRIEFGYPAGLMSKCPGSTKPSSIPKSQLKYLSFLVQGNGRSRSRYTYWNARKIAADPRLNFQRRTMVVANGYLDSPNLPITSMIANEYEDLGYNVIMLDYQRFTTVHYHLACRLLRPVGKHVAEVLAQLMESGLDPARLELIGFSLGGQAVSYIATQFQRITHRNISTIFSLEPAGPCFRNLPPNDRLTASNADFVQVIHTNIDGYGMATPMGHVDFYINGGEYQPSDLNLYPCTTTCSHFKVLLLWMAAFKYPKQFIGMKCESVQQARDSDCYKNSPLVTNLMGLEVDRSKYGIFYLATTKEYPFYLGLRGLNPQYVFWRTLTDVNEGNETEIYT